MPPNLRSPAVPFLDPDAVARVLAPRTVVATEDLGGSFAPVVRATLDDGATVVVKERRPHRGGWGFDAANLRNERAALEALGEAPFCTEVAPGFLGGDDAAGVLVMTDLGPGPTVEHHLLDPSGRADAAGALVEHGRALARLHAATAAPAIRRAFDRRRRALEPSYDPAAERTRYSTFELPALWGEVAGFADALGFRPPTGTEGDIAQLWRELADPGPFLVLTSYDPNPQNGVLVADGTVRIVDFEGAALRHLGIDAAFLRFPFPSYGHWAVLPEAVRTTMEAAYRETLVERGFTVAGDDAAYERAMAVGCAATVVLRTHRLPRIADDAAAEAGRRRTQMVSAIGVFADACERARMFPTLAVWFTGLADEMRARWREANDPPREFPALPLQEVASP